MDTKLILNQLVKNEDYVSKTLPFIKKDYFEDPLEQSIFSYIQTFRTDYNESPSTDVIKYYVSQDNDLRDDQIDEMETLWNDIIIIDTTEMTVDWLVNITEEWCKDRAMYLAVMEAIKIITDDKKKASKNTVPDIMKEALAVSFDTNVGHNYGRDASERYEYYHRKESKIPFDIELLNKITKGGFTPGTLNLFLGGTNSGKTLFMCHLAGSYMKAGYNVLYITLEIAEELIAQRIDANLMNKKLSEVISLTQDSFLSNVDKITKKTIGQLVIKQYPPASVNINHFRALLNELSLKESFKPDVIIVDYLGLCLSARVKSAENSFTYYKSVAEEVRGLAVERQIPIISNHQFNRSGQYNTDVDLENISESHGISMTADFMAAIIVTEEFIESNRVMIKQLKSRYNDPNYYSKFMIGMDREKMRLHNLEDEEIVKTINVRVDGHSKPETQIDFS